MKTFSSALAYMVLILSLNAPAMAIQIDGNKYILSEAEVRTCRDGGGCIVIPLSQLQNDLIKLQEGAWAEGAKHGSRLGYEAGYEAGVRAKHRGTI